MSMSNIKKIVNEHTQRKYLSWLGGSLLSSLQSFNEMWISK